MSFYAVTLYPLCGYFLLLTAYNFFLHPLRNCPGPLWARCSNFWGRYQNLHGRKAHKIQEAHLRYGPIVRIAPNALSFSNPAVIREIYGSRSFVKEEGFYVRPSVMSTCSVVLKIEARKTVVPPEPPFEFPVIQSLAATPFYNPTENSDPEAHHERRKLMSRGFSQAALREFEPRIASKVSTLLGQWARLSANKTVIDVYPWVHMLGFDIIYHLMFDVDPGTLNMGKEHTVMPWMRAWKPTFIYKEIMPQLERLGPYVPGKIGGYFRDVQKWKIFAMEIVRSCRDNGTKTPFLGKVSLAEDGFLGRPLTDSELAEECMGGMFGGSGTTATTFTYILWASLRKPDVVDKLKKELYDAFPDRFITPDSVSCGQLPYLQAVIHETMRLYPATIAILPRTATEDTVLDGCLVPKGTNVGTQNFTIHRNEKAFPDAEEFNPDRWMVKDDGALKEAFTPFSVGSRKCIGSNLAEMELGILTASFFRRFNASVDESMTEDDMRMYDTFNAAPIGGRLLLHLTEAAT